MAQGQTGADPNAPNYFAQPNPPGAQPWAAQPMMPMGSIDDERGGLKWAKVGSILGILGLVMGLSTLLLLFTADNWLLSIASSASPPSATTIVTTVEILFGLLIGGLILQLLMIIMYTISFRSLRRVDPSFGAPFGLALCGSIGVLLMFAGFGGFFAAVLSLATCVGNAASAGTANTCASIGISGVFALLALVAIGGLLALVGWIGIVLGFWRMGRRYDSGLLKAGGILYIIPFAAAIAPFLTLFGTMGAEKRLNARAVPVPAPPTG